MRKDSDCAILMGERHARCSIMQVEPANLVHKVSGSGGVMVHSSCSWEY
jgi:hypothetical protein